MSQTICYFYYTNLATEEYNNILFMLTIHYYFVGYTSYALGSRKRAGEHCAEQKRVIH